MTSQTIWPAGIRPTASGKIRVRIWRGGRTLHAETLDLSAAKPTDRAAAMRYRAELLARASMGLPIGGSASELLLFGEAAQRYLGALALDQDTIAAYSGLMRRVWLPVFAALPLGDISRAVVLDRLAQLSLAQSSKRNALIPLAGVYAYLDLPNPAHGITLGKMQAQDVLRYSPDERAALLAQLAGQERVYFSLLFATGIRPGEACGLQWRDWDGERLHVRRQITMGSIKTHTKTYRARKVYVPNWVRPLLLSSDTREAGEWIFTSPGGGPLMSTTQNNHAWRTAHLAAGIPYRRPYTCRHTRAAELLSTGVDPAAAAIQLGHSPQMFFRIYSEFIDEYSDHDFSDLESASAQNTPTIHRQFGGA